MQQNPFQLRDSQVHRRCCHCYSTWAKLEQGCKLSFSRELSQGDQRANVKSAASSSTLIERWRESIETIIRSLPLRRMIVPSSPSSGPRAIRIRLPGLECG